MAVLLAATGGRSVVAEADRQGDGRSVTETAARSGDHDTVRTAWRASRGTKSQSRKRP